MASKWHQKKAKQAEEAFERDLQSRPDDTAVEIKLDHALGKGDEQVFERKLTKEEKKAQAKAKREAKKKQKMIEQGIDPDQPEEEEKKTATEILEKAKQEIDQAGENRADNDGVDHEAADALAAAGTICTYSRSRKGVDARSRDINVTNFTLQHMGAVLLDETEIVLNHGNRYGLIARNGAGKSTLLKALGSRAVPIPKSIDIFFLSEEIEPSDTMTALDAVMAVDEERLALETQADELNHLMATLAESGGEPDEDGKTTEEQQEEIMEALNTIYERLDALDADTAEVRARLILKGLGFTHEMQHKLTKDFSGGWRMRLARALLVEPMFLVLDEPTNHLDMEAVIWLEDYLSRWNRILLLVSHSAEFLDNVCTHIIHLTSKRKLVYYDGNYTQFVKTRSEMMENQWKQYRWEQDQIKSMKEYIARFGHGTAKNAKQAQSKEKVLQKMIRAGLTEKPEDDKPMNFKFTNPGHLPPPVLAFHDVSFGYPNCEPLYTNVNLGVDLDSRIALVGPNGAGKTTLVKLMAGELLPTLGDIRPHGHLKLGRFTQHFVDVLDLEKSPLEFFEKCYPDDPREDQRKYLGRFGLSGKMQVQKMAELSDGQKSRVVFAKLGRDTPHILLLDEPTNHLDMESIDALAKAVNEFEGGMVLVSHDMRLISQVAKEIWICDNKTITRYDGDIANFKMDMRAQMGITGELKGDASVKKKEDAPTPSKPAKKEPSLEVISPGKSESSPTKDDDANAVTDDEEDNDADTATATTTSATTGVSESSEGGPKKYVPPHLRKKMMEEGA